MVSNPIVVARSRKLGSAGPRTEEMRRIPSAPASLARPSCISSTTMSLITTVAVGDTFFTAWTALRSSVISPVGRACGLIIRR